MSFSVLVLLFRNIRVILFSFLKDGENMEFSEKIKYLRKKNGLTLEEVGNVVGVGKSTVRKWESGEIANMRRDKIALLAQALHVTPAYLMGWEDDPEPQRPLPSNLKPLSELHHLKVPMIGKVAAGQPIMAEQDFETFVDSPVKCDAALTVEGDSMAPGFQSGDIVYVRCQPDVRDGQIAVVLIDDSATLKHVYHDPEGLTLISDNPAYSPIRVTGTEHDYIAIYGIVVGFTRMFKDSNPMAKVKKGFK